MTVAWFLHYVFLCAAIVNLIKARNFFEFSVGVGCIWAAAAFRSRIEKGTRA